MINKPSTQLEADLLAKDELVIRAGEAAHHMVSVLKSIHDAFWSLPTDRLLAILNHDIPATLATFSSNTAIGSACNQSLYALGLDRYPNRAPTSMPDGWEFVDGQFTYSPPSDNPTQPE